MTRDDIECKKLSALVSYKKHLDKLDKLVKEQELDIASGGSRDRLSYLLPALHDLYDMLIRYEQFGVDLLEEDQIYKRSRQVIKSRRYIPEDVLDIYRPEKTIVDSMYLSVDVYILDKEAVQRASKKNHRGVILDPEKFGLPSASEVMYGTRKVVDDRTYVAIAKDQWISDYIYHTYHFEYPTLSLDGVECIYE